MRTKLPGLLFVFIGLLTLIYKAEIVPVQYFLTWPFIFFFCGVIIVILSFSRRNAQGAFIGGIIATVNIFIWGKKYVIGWPTHWSVLLVAIGLVTLVMYSINKDALTGMVGMVIVIYGVFSYPEFQQHLPLISPLGRALNTYWPTVLIGVGVIFLLKKNKKRSK